MTGLAAGTVTLPGSLGFTRLVLHRGSAGFGFYDHGTP